MQYLRGFQPRTLIVSVVVLLLFSLLVGQLINLQLRTGEENLVSAEETKKKTITLKGSRGSITDRNGLLLAYDMPSYDLEFYCDPSQRTQKYRKEYSEALLQVIDIVEENHGKTIDRFSIVRNEQGVLAFDWRTTDPEVAKIRRKQWFTNFYLEETIDDVEVTAEQAYQALRTRYTMGEMPWEQASKVLAIWEDWQSKAYMTKPVVIARNIDIKAVAEIEVQQYELLGVSIAQSTTRMYPRGESAAHIIGYMGAITDESLSNYVGELKYAPSDLIGVSGIEKSMEEQLTGNITYRQGSRTVEVNSKNRIMRELTYTPAKNGNNIVLTIDLPLQILMEQEFAKNIESTRIEQLAKMETATDKKKAFYQNTMIARDASSLHLAAAGAVVVMEVKTGKVLSMVSHPGFNPNDFVGGLSDTSYQKYFDTERSELAKLSPTYNRAISTRATPGSIFKMVTGIAGVMENAVTIDQKITDDSPYDLHIISGKAPRCWIDPNYYLHADMTLSSAITNSCNYYFFTISDAMGIDKINTWSTKLGLTSKTGIELGNEATGIVGNQKVLYDITKEPSKQSVARTKVTVNNVRNELNNLRTRLQRDYDDERIERVLTSLMELGVNPTEDVSSSIRTILMSELGLSNQEVASVVYNIQIQLNDLRWNVNETILSGIGQSITEVTPIAVARYISALANGGTVYEARIVERILDTNGSLLTQKEPVVFSQLEGVDAALDAIKLGMRGVVDSEERGTAAKYFKNYPYTNQIAGKTGTAQVNLVDIENNAWFVSYAPYDDPEIAVVVFIANGMSGGYASPTAQAAFNYYFENKNIVYTDPNPIAGSFIP